MKNLFAFALFLFVGIAAQAQAKIEFKEETVDYGDVEYGGDGLRTFRFTNTGNEPLTIEKATATCGCTVPEKPEEPIAPGETGELKVKYNTRKVGYIRKTITVYSNAEGSPHSIKIKGKILEKDTKSVLEK
ncbi:DUF1573 domain-containing protein [Mesonia aestuariivivens]|uniref:DUF1573 domain-containing protein n=1 Tax=Mesonia aestuariivivens TaxID=2796128 RepID=A0ABS6W533_9FLAO|nr:DUF1573 domain-containing protein [Mesonia aestuariivivens]MBW2962976.1 DUF1573 domain-containing protein [Mesonia aestuariivivens]